jgi:RNA polymerase sigma factor (TIGR02999 family)
VERLAAGDTAAEPELLPLVYQELRRAADGILRGRAAGNTLQATVLVHEAWLRMCGSDPSAWESRAHFVAVACKAMRQILANHARDRAAHKRGGAGRRLTIDRVLEQQGDEAIDVLALDDALRSLGARSERQAHIVELRVFGGLTIEETARLLELGETTVKAEWRFARAWLKRQFAGGGAAEAG